MTRRLLSIVLFTLFVIASGGCGQKGPLYLPQEPTSAEPVTTEDPDDEEEETEKSQ